VLRIEFPGQRADAGSVYARQGFRLSHVELEMARDLRAPLPAGELPDGLALVSWAPERAGRFYATCRDAFSTRPGPGKWTQDEWVTGFAGGDTFRPDLSWLAVGAGAAAAGAGYIMCDVRPGPAPSGAGAGAPRRPVGGIRRVGVRPAWRSRGVASALLGAALRAFRAEGLDHAHLEVNENNPTARRLYERLGFEVAGRYTVYTKALSAPG
jgi:ribosomal protein S18 acetylase RimI-like enzyme